MIKMMKTQWMIYHYDMQGEVYLMEVMMMKELTQVIDQDKDARVGYLVNQMMLDQNYYSQG